MKRAFFIFLAMLGFTCSGSHVPFSSNTVVTSDYYGIREVTNGYGWNAPADLERALEGETRPVIAIFSAVWCIPCKELKDEIIRRGWRNDVIIVDVEVPENEARVILYNLGNAVPTMLYLGKTENEKVVLSGYYEVMEFLEKHFKEK